MAQEQGSVNRYQPSDMPLQSSKEQVTMWQQNTYMADSGIHSIASSKTPSMSGKEIDSSTEWGDSQHSRYRTQQVEDMQMDPRCQRVRTDIYPESIDEGIPDVIQYDQSHQTSSHKFSDSSQMLRHAVDNLINSQDDADVAARAIPELIKLLNDEDQVIVSQAAEFVEKLSKKEASKHAILNSQPMIAALVRALANTNDFETTRITVGALYSLSQYKQGLLSIIRAGGIIALVKLLSSPVESILYYSITSLHNLLQSEEEAKNAVRQTGCISKMVALLQRNNVKFITIVTDCLRILAFGHQETKLIILSAQGPQALIRNLKTYNYESLLYHTCRALKVLSICPSNKPVIVEAGGMQALSVHLGHHNQKVVENCLYTLRNLSDAATKAENIDGLLHSLVQLLKVNDSRTVTCCVGILSNLTCYNQHNKSVVCNVNGINFLLSTIFHNSANEQITEPAICALRHLTSGYNDAEHARNIFRKNGIQLIISLLEPMSRWPLIKAIVGLFKNLVVSTQNHIYFRETGAIDILVKVLIKAFHETQKQRSRLSSGASSTVSGLIDGVRMEELLEGTVSSLHVLSKDQLNRQIIRSHNVIPVFVQLLYYDMENIQRVSAAVLQELAGEREGVELIEKERASDILTQLLQSRNEAVVTYAAALLIRLSEDKPAEYKKRFSAEISSIFREEGMWSGDMQDFKPLPEFKPSNMQEYKPSIPDFNPHEGLSSFDPMYSGPPSVQGHPHNFPGGFEHVPVDSMQALDIATHGSSSSYGPIESMDIPRHDIAYDPPPQPPRDNNQMPWYDTDL